MTMLMWFFAQASNSWFGDVYGQVHVTCRDGDNNPYDFYSDDARLKKKAAVFFPPDKDVNGNNAKTKKTEPCWFKFWKDGKVIDGIEKFGYDANTPYIAYYDGKKNAILDLKRRIIFHIQCLLMRM